MLNIYLLCSPKHAANRVYLFYMLYVLPINYSVLRHTANWDGFKDEECGIYGYAWSVGTTVCGTDVATFVDPHSTIHNRDDWTYTGLAKGLHLPDGPYYVTVQVGLG